MLKKDRIAIAKMIKAERDVYGYTQPCKRFANELANYIATDNPYFNKQEFMKSCGITD